MDEKTLIQRYIPPGDMGRLMELYASMNDFMLPFTPEEFAAKVGETLFLEAIKGNSSIRCHDTTLPFTDFVKGETHYYLEKIHRHTWNREGNHFEPPVDEAEYDRARSRVLVAFVKNSIKYFRQPDYLKPKIMGSLTP